MERKAIIKLVAAIALLVVAAVIMMNTGSEEPAPEGAKTAWYCVKCDRGFELVGDQMRQSVKQMRMPSSSGGAAIGGEAGPQVSRDTRGLAQVAKCPYCGQWHGFAARQCPECGEIFPIRMPDGAEPKCPKCGWNPADAR